MSFFPYLSFFFVTLVMSSFMSISANNWIYIWLSLELNLLSFIPIMMMSKQNQETEAAVKYFMAQALGSSLLLLGSVSMYMSPQTITPASLLSWLMILGILTKMGMPPCHFWFPLVVASLSWPLCMIILTWQKLAPILILFSIMSNINNNLFIFIIFLGTLISSLGGMNQSQLRPLLAYSSIMHMTWMIAGAMYSLTNAYIYFFIYLLISLSMIMLLWSFNKSSPSLMNTMSNNNYLYMLCIVLLFLSLGGIPPLLGFLPKMMIIQSITDLGNIFMPLLLIMGSVMNLFYYLNMIFISLFNNNKPSIITPLSSNYNIKPMLISTSLIGFIPIIMIYAMILFNQP